MLEGSNIARGRKNRKNIRKQVVKNPATVAHTMRRRILLTVGSGVLSTTEATGFAGATARGGALAGTGTLVLGIVADRF